jgi:transcriptional regulator with XRE-family HTH domain
MDRDNIKRGAFLKEVRTANLLTEKELAELLDVEPDDITVWETGIKFPDDENTLERLSKALNVTKKELMNGNFNKSRENQIVEVKFNEEDKPKRESVLLSNTAKNILLVVLSVVVFVILVGTIASLNKNNNKTLNNKSTIVEEVSDEREPVKHVPHTSNEHIIYNTQALSANDSSNYDGYKLLDYGFHKSGNKYVKSGRNYRIEYYNSTFYLTLTTSGGKLYVTRDIRDGLLIYKDANRARSVTVEMNPPSGKMDCDKDLCTYNTDYYKYLNLLVGVIRG